jgi:tagatose-1,6-bisphosphate aldolase
VKVLVYYHPDSSTADEIESFVGQVAEDCARQDLLLMLEPLSYSLDQTRKLTPEEKRYVVIETAKRLTSLNVDILKAEFPLDISETDQTIWQEACQEISSASCVPWILLSAAADYETYLRQVTVACHAGASGVAVGRAVWQEAISLTGRERGNFLSKVASQRLARLASLCAALARPYAEFYMAEAPFDWYKIY